MWSRCECKEDRPGKRSAVKGECRSEFKRKREDEKRKRKRGTRLWGFLKTGAGKKVD